MTHTVDEEELTVEDLYSLPDDDYHYELEAGTLLSEPPPGGRHGRVATRVVRLLSTYVEEHQLGVVYTCDAGYVLG